MQPLDLLLVQFGALLERREPRLPEDLVDPGAADAGDVALVAEQRVQVARLVDRRGELLERRRRARLPGRGVATVSSSSTASAGSSFAQARCLVPNSRRRSSRPSSSRISTREARSFSEARLSKTRSRPADIRWISSARSPNSTTGILPTRRTPVTSRPTSASSGGSKVFITFIPGASADSTVGARQRGVEAARGDLDLGQLGHAERLDLDASFIRLVRGHADAGPANIRKGRAHAGAPDDPTHLHRTLSRPRRSLRSARRCARSPPSATPSSSPTTTSCPRSRTSPTTWATRSASRARPPPPTPTRSPSAASTSWPRPPRSSRPRRPC